MSTPEGDVKKYLKKRLKELGVLGFSDCVAAIDKGEYYHGYYFMAASNGMGEAGVSDFVICVMGKYMEVEVKSEEGDQSDIQKKHEEVLTRCLGDYFLVKGIDEVDSFIGHLNLLIGAMRHAINHALEIKHTPSLTGVKH